MQIFSRESVQQFWETFTQIWEQFILVVIYLYLYQTGKKDKNKILVLGKY